MNKLITFIIFISVIIFAIYFELDNALFNLIVEKKSKYSWLIFIILATISTVLFVPGSIIGIVGGLAFGTYLGTVLVVISATFGSVISFMISRYFGDIKFLKSSKHFKNMDEYVVKHGIDILIITRLFPIFPFNVQNYYYGLTSISLIKYTIITFITLIPGTFIYVYFANRIYYDSSNFAIYILILSTILCILYFISKKLYKK